MSDQSMTFVLLDRFVELNMAALAEALRARHPELPVVRSDVGNSPVIECGDQSIVLMSMPAPIQGPPGIWTRAETRWSDAKAVAARHQGHVIVSTMSKREPRLLADRIITAVIGALISVTPECCAVMWQDMVVRPAKLWQDMSRHSFAPFPDYPFMLWLEVLPFRSGAMNGAVTKGLSAFVGREIEFESGKLDLPTVMDKVEGLAVYLVEYGAVIKDGHTFGVDERERFKVRYENSARFPGLPVLLCSPS
jgi:hypothetical protein